MKSITRTGWSNAFVSPFRSLIIALELIVFEKNHFLFCKYQDKKRFNASALFRTVINSQWIADHFYGAIKINFLADKKAV